MADARSVIVDGHRIVYDAVGNGPALMLVPGFMMHRGRWHHWGYVDRLRTDYRVLAVDPLGHGESDKPHDPSAYSWSACARHVLAVLDAENVDHAALWGYSRGSALVAAVLTRHPGRMWAAVLGGVGLEDETESTEAQHTALERGDWDGYWSTSRIPLPPEVRAWMSELNDPLAMAAAARGGRLEPFDVPAGPVPVLIYNGDGEDPIVQSCEEARARGFECHVLPTGGHGETFSAMSACCDLVEPFLASAIPLGA